MTLVLAGNYKQYDRWRRETGIMDSRYVRGFSDIAGCQDCTLVKVGTWWENREHYRVMDYAMTHNIANGEE